MISTTTADDLVREACEAEGWTMARSVQWLACETDEDFRDLARRDPFFAPGRYELEHGAPAGA